MNCEVRRDISTEMIQISSGAYGMFVQGLLVLFDYEGANPVSAEHFPPALLRVTPNRPRRPLNSNGVTQTWRKSHAPPLTGLCQGRPVVPGVWTRVRARVLLRGAGITATNQKHQMTT